MNKLKQYFSLLKFSIINPKAGVEIVKTEKQVRKDSKNEIKKLNTNPKKIEEIINELFPKMEFSVNQFYEETQSLRNHINLFYEKLNDKKFPSKEKPYPTDYSVPVNSGLLIYIICKTINPKKIFETGVAYGHSSCFILEALSKNENSKVNFVITDNKNILNVSYVGILPDLFREGQGAVIEGVFLENNTIVATKVFAKHDENYMPNSIKKELEKNDYWKKDYK